MPKVEKIREAKSIAAKRKAANENGGLAFKLVQARKDGLDLPDAMDAVLGKTRPDMPLFHGAAWVALPGSEPVPLDQRTGCAWPIGEDSPFLWCNLPISGAGSFCAHHHKWSIARK